MQGRAQHCLSLMLHMLSSSNIIAYPHGDTPLSLILLKLLHSQLPRHLITCKNLLRIKHSNISLQNTHTPLISDDVFIDLQAHVVDPAVLGTRLYCAFP